MPVSLSGPPLGLRGSRVDAKQFVARARKLLAAIGHRRSELSIALIGDAEMAELNGTWRGKPRTTDVLSFSLLEGEAQERRGALLGDVVISVETAAAQAAARHRGLDEELTRLLIHGLLHLIGYDHESDAEARVMEAEQRRLWREISA